MTNPNQRGRKRDQSVVKTLGKIRQLAKSLTRSGAGIPIPPELKPHRETEPLHHLNPGVSLDAKYDDVRRVERDEAFEGIRPRVSLLPIQDIVCTAIVIALRIGICLSLVMAVIFGHWIHDGTEDLFKHSSILSTIWGILLMILSAVGVIAVLPAIQLMCHFEEQFASAAGSGVRSESLEAFLGGLSDKETEEIFERLPWRLKELGVDSMEWGNEVIDVFWPNIARHVYREVKKILDEEMWVEDLVKSEKLEVSLRVLRLTLGKQPPRVSGIRVFGTSTSRYDDLVIQTEVGYDLDGEVQVLLHLNQKFKLPFGLDEVKVPNLHLGLNEFRFRMKLELVASPLLSQLPCLGGITLTLMEEPTLKWNFTGLLFVLNPLAPLLSKILYFLPKVPHPLHFDLTPYYTVLDMDLVQATALVTVQIHSGRDIPHVNLCLRSSPDTFVHVEIDDTTQWTSVAKSSSNPVYNQSFTFLIKDAILGTNPIRITLYDEDVDKDVEMGQIMIPLKLVQQPDLNGRTLLVPLLDSWTVSPIGTGTTSLQVRMITLPLSAEVIPRPLTAFPPPAVISVFIDSARGLLIPVPSMRSPELRVLVRVTIGTHVKVSRIRERTGTPVWKQVLVFPLHEPTSDEILVEVLDVYHVMEKRSIRYFGRKIKDTFANWKTLSEKGSKLGHVVLRPPFVNGMRKEVALEGILEKAFITIATDTRYCGWDDNIYTNWNLPPAVVSLEVLANNTPGN